MLKTNSKKAKENTRKYIIDIFNDYVSTNETGDDPVETVKDAAAVIFADCKRVLNITHNNYVSQAAFTEYAAMLPGYVETFGYTAFETLAAILEETPEEAAHYTNQDAEKVLSAIVYRELFNALLRGNY